MAFLLVLAIIIVLAPLVSAAARRMERPSLPGVPPEEVARLREELDQLSAQVSRLQEEQSFMVRLLSEGARSAGTLGEGGASSTDRGGRGVGPTDREETHRPEPKTPDGGP